MRIRVFGGLEVEPVGGQAATVTRRSALVLALLVVVGPKGLRREQICGLLWGRREEKQARASLRQALVELRRYCAGSGRTDLQILGDMDVIALSSPPGEIDLWRFDELLTDGRSEELAEAAALFNGVLLAGVELPEEVEDWIKPHRENYLRKALRLAEELSEASNSKGFTMDACEVLAKRLIQIEPTAEEAHRALIRIYKRQGKTSAAARQLKTCTDTLRQTLGVAPEQSTTALLAEPMVSTSAGSIGNPSDRIQHHPRPNKPSMVVMPFENLSVAEDDHLVIGIVEEVTATLSRIRDFFVISRHSALRQSSRIR